MKLRLMAGALLSVAILCSCTTKRSPLTYFTNVDQTPAATITLGQYLSKIEPGDELYIMVTSTNPQATAAYNMPLSNPAKTELMLGASTPQQLTYIVNSNGCIDFPVLGRISVEGLTTEQVAQKLTDLIAPEVDDPTVVCRLVNFKINVSGEVRNPGTYPVSAERFSILDALSAAGDLTEYGERNNVLLIREENGQRTSHRLDLNDASLLSSPYFYVKQNDYIYVEPNQIRRENSKYNQNNAFKLTVISTVVSAASVIASLVIALTIK